MRRIQLIHVADYPRALYTAYWEIQVMGEEGDGFVWGVRIHDYQGNLLEERSGPATTRDEADTQAQTCVLNTMTHYRR